MNACALVCNICRSIYFLDTANAFRLYQVYKKGNWRPNLLMPRVDQQKAAAGDGEQLACGIPCMLAHLSVAVDCLADRAALLSQPCHTAVTMRFVRSPACRWCSGMLSIVLCHMAYQCQWHRVAGYHDIPCSAFLMLLRLTAAVPAALDAALDAADLARAHAYETYIGDPDDDDEDPKDASPIEDDPLGQAAAGDFRSLTAPTILTLCIV